jgi:HEAT repeat protein
MELAAIQASLKNPDYHHRLKAISALKTHPAADALPLLKHHQEDEEFLVRSFVARELGNFLNEESFAILLEMMRRDNTPNVRAEAANSLSYFGVVTAGHLVSTFLQDDHWLVRRSILAALVDLACHTPVWEVCQEAIGNLEDAPTREVAVRTLGSLAQTSHKQGAIDLLTQLSQDPDWRIRQQVAYALKPFDPELGQALLQQLRQDPDHHVVGAVLEAS